MSPSTIPLLLSLLTTLTSALPTLTPRQSGDGGGGTPPSGGIGYDPSAVGDDNTGSDGADHGGVNLSTGATIAIGVVAGIVVIIGTTTAILFYLSKKRQWELGTRARKSIKRVGTGIKEAMTPRTPHKMTFSPIEKSYGSDRAGLISNKHRDPSSSPKRGRDLEKGPEAVTTTYTATVTAGPGLEDVDLRGPPSLGVGEGRSERSGSHTRGLSLDTKNLGMQGGRTGQKIKEQKVEKKDKRKPAPLSGGQMSRFDMDSPETPMWHKFVGRR